MKYMTAAVLLVAAIVIGAEASVNGRHTLFIEELCFPGTQRCLSEVLWDGDHFETDQFSTEDLLPATGGSGTSLTTTGDTVTSLSSGGSTSGFPGFYAKREEEGGTGFAPGREAVDGVVDDEQGGRAWGTEDDLAREEEAKLIEAERLRMQEDTGIYMATNQFDEFEAGSVVRSRDSNILKKIEELYGGMPWANSFTEARENLKQIRNVTRRRLDGHHKRAAVVESIRGGGVAGSINVASFDVPHSSRQGPVRAYPINSILGSSLKRMDARTAVGIGGVYSMLEGVSGNYPVHFRKQVDSSSPFFFQAATDFDPYGTWRFDDPTDRTCPHLFNFQFVLRLEQRIATRLELHLSFVDAIITEVKMSIAPSKTEQSPLYEDVYFMYRGLTYSLYDSGTLIDSGAHTDGFRDGVPPVPIPGGDEGCCEEMPWSLSPAPDCSAFELNYPVTLNPSPAPLQPWDVDK